MFVGDAADVERVETVLLGDVPGEHAAVPHPENIPVSRRKWLGRPWGPWGLLAVPMQKYVHPHTAIAGGLRDFGGRLALFAQPEDFLVSRVRYQGADESVLLGDEVYPLPGETHLPGDLCTRHPLFPEDLDPAVTLRKLKVTVGRLATHTVLASNVM